VTQAVFGAAHPLTAHRLLRLASVRIGQNRGEDAAPLLAVVADMLSPYPEDSGLHEAKFYQGLLQVRVHGLHAGLACPPPRSSLQPPQLPPHTLQTTNPFTQSAPHDHHPPQAGAAASPSDVSAADDALLPAVKALCGAMGPDSMILRLALGQHSRLVGLALDHKFSLGEAMFKQHIKLQVGSWVWVGFSWLYRAEADACAPPPRMRDCMQLETRLKRDPTPQTRNPPCAAMHQPCAGGHRPRLPRAGPLPLPAGGHLLRPRHAGGRGGHAAAGVGAAAAALSAGARPGGLVCRFGGKTTLRSAC
jgi:hypothetical protein